MLYLNATPPEAAQGKDVLRLWLSSTTFCVRDVGCSCESGAAPSCSTRQGAAPSAVGSLNASGWNLAKKSTPLLSLGDLHCLSEGKLPLHPGPGYLSTWSPTQSGLLGSWPTHRSNRWPRWWCSWVTLHRASNLWQGMVTTADGKNIFTWFQHSLRT